MPGFREAFEFNDVNLFKLHSEATPGFHPGAQPKTPDAAATPMRQARSPEPATHFRGCPPVNGTAIGAARNVNPAP